jgi:hypothetical protein
MAGLSKPSTNSIFAVMLLLFPPPDGVQLYALVADARAREVPVMPNVQFTSASPLTLPTVTVKLVDVPAIELSGWLSAWWPLRHRG